MTTVGNPSLRVLYSRTELTFGLAAILVTLLASVIDQAIASIAMPHVVASLNGFARFSWPSTAFSLCATIAMPVFAKLSDLYGRKPLYLSAAGMYLVFLPFGAAAGLLPIPMDGMSQFVVARALLGLANGGIIVLTYTLIADLFPPSERARYEGLVASVWAVGYVVAPSVGGWVSDHITWRWAFLLNLPLAVVAILSIRLWLPNISPTLVRRSIDWAGMVTLCGWTVPLMIGLTWLGEAGWSRPGILPVLGLSAGAFAVFIWAERRAQEPMFVLGLFHDHRIALVLANLLLTGVGLYGTAVYLPLFVQGVLGWSTAKSALIFTPYILATMVGNLAGGHLLSLTRKYHMFAVVFSALTAVGSFLLARMDTTTTEPEILFSVITCGIGFGALVLTYDVLVQNIAPREHLGVATGATQFFQALGGSMGLAILGSLLLRAYHVQIDAVLPHNAPTELMRAFDNPLRLAFEKPNLDFNLLHLANGPELLAGLLKASRAGLRSGVHRIYLFNTVLLAATLLSNLLWGKERTA